MATSKEIKIGELLANSVEDHWFNPATLARYMADQPIYTLDRIMELVAQIIHYQTNRYGLEQVNGRTSEGLLLAAKLDKVVKSIKHTEHIKLPKEHKEYFGGMKNIEPTIRYSHIRGTNSPV